MKYKLTNKEYVKFAKRYIDMNYEVRAASLDEAVNQLSKHIFNMSKEEIRRALVAN